MPEDPHLANELTGEPSTSNSQAPANSSAPFVAADAGAPPNSESSDKAKPAFASKLNRPISTIASAEFLDNVDYYAVEPATDPNATEQNQASAEEYVDASGAEYAQEEEPELQRPASSMVLMRSYSIVVTSEHGDESVLDEVGAAAAAATLAADVGGEYNPEDGVVIVADEQQVRTFVT